MLPLMIPAIASLAVGAGQALGGAFMNPIRPKATIAGGVSDMLANAKRLAGQTRLPGQDRIEQNMDESMSNFISNIQNMSGGNPQSIGGLSKLYAQNLNAKNALGVSAAQYHAGNQGQLQNALRAYANEQNRVWDYNQNQPYQEQAATKSALIGGGMKNMMGGLKDIIGTGFYGSMINRLQDQTTGANSPVQTERMNPVKIPGQMPQLQPNNTGYVPFSQMKTTVGEDQNDNESYIPFPKKINPFIPYQY